MSDQKVCCGKPMILFDNIGFISNEIDYCTRYICLDCGSYLQFEKGQMDMEDVLNNLNNYGNDTDKKMFVELHPEFINEVI